MSYPNAFCVKCRSHTPTMEKHTVVLANSARAVTGKCQSCGSEVYKILPKKDPMNGHASRKSSGRKRSNVIALKTNHRPNYVANAKRATMDGTSFLIGAMAGIVLMLGIVIARLYT